jgi:hypothetical protein
VISYPARGVVTYSMTCDEHNVTTPKEQNSRTNQRKTFNIKLAASMTLQLGHVFIGN